MKARQRWFYFVLVLMIASLVLVACERPLPGGYNDPEAGSDTSVPEVPETIPEVDSEAYPADVEPAAPVEVAPDAYPAEALQSAEAYPADGAEAAGEEEVAAPESDQTDVAEEVPADVEAAPEEEAPAPEEAAPAPEEAAAAEDAATTEESEDVDAGDTPGTHTIAVGENLFRIGLLYGVSWLDLAEANDIADPANLTVGQVLTIPTPDSTAEETAEVEAVESEPVDEPEATEAESTEEVTEAAGEEAATDSAERPATYIVQAGDNLFRIGVSLGIDWNEIVAANGIINNQIYPGQELIIPAASASDEAEQAVDEEAVETEETESPQEGETPSEATPGLYVVLEGDSIYSVAFQHGIPWTLLVEANELEAPYTLEVGQSLAIPASE